MLSRFHAVEGDIGRSATLKELWDYAESHTPESRPADYTQAIMDLGASVCVRNAPKCDSCPLASRCEAFASGRAGELPRRRRAGAKPVRRARMYLVTIPGGACLLERRGAGGVWGGLWTPPQRGADCTPVEICREFGIDDRAVLLTRTGPVFRHTFSHFHLDIEPVHLPLDDIPGQVSEGDQTLWYRPGETQAVGMPAPAVKLLAGALSGQGDSG